MTTIHSFMALIIGITLAFALEPVSTAADKLPPDTEREKISTQDSEFLTRQCGIVHDDIAVIQKLKKETRESLYGLIAKRDCNGLQGFKAVREFVKKYTPPPKETYMPPKGYKDYTTIEEINYINENNTRILNKIFEDFHKK